MALRTAAAPTANNPSLQGKIILIVQRRVRRQLLQRQARRRAHTLVKSSKKTDDDQEIWNLLQDEVPAERKPVDRGEAAVARDFQWQMDDEIPF